MDSGKSNNERELTSTMGNVLSVSIKDEKNDTSGNDATPTSSTDASTTTASSQIVSDDPISSTSSDIIELNKSKTLECNMQSSAETCETVMETPNKVSPVDPETDLLEMSISSVSRERITEDVEDLVHDLESLLGESTDSFNIPVKRKEERKSLEEKENVQKGQIFAEGDSLSLGDSSVDKNIELIKVCVTDKNVIKEISCSSQEDEQIGTSGDSNRQKDILCNISNTEVNESSSKNICSDVDKELPVNTTFDSEVDLVCKNDTESSECQPNARVENDSESTEVENVENEVENLNVTITKEECLTEDEKERTVEIVQNTDNVNTNKIEEKSTAAQEEVDGEPLQEKTEEITSEIEGDLENKINDYLQKREGATVLSMATNEDPITSNTSNNTNDERHEFETTEEAVCQEESISRDTKTEAVEIGGDKHEKGEHSNASESNSQNDKTPTDSYPLITETLKECQDNNLESEDVVLVDNLSENKTVEESAKELHEKNDDSEHNSVDASGMRSIHESSDHLQIEQDEGDTQKIIIPTNISEEMASNSNDVEIATTLSAPKNISESIIENAGGSAGGQGKNIELLKEEESAYIIEPESETNIPQCTKAETVLDSTFIETVENAEVGEVITQGEKAEVGEVITRGENAEVGEVITQGEKAEVGEVITRGENADVGEVIAQEVSSESGVPKSSIIDHVQVCSDLDESTAVNEVDLPLESIQEETSQIEGTVEVECSTIETHDSEVDSATEETTDTLLAINESKGAEVISTVMEETVIEISEIIEPQTIQQTITEIVECIEEKVVPPSNDFPTEDRPNFTDLIPDGVEQYGSSNVPQLEETLDASIKTNESIEAKPEIEIENTGEKIDEEIVEPETLPEKVTESNEFAGSESKQSNDQDTGIDEISEEPESLPEKVSESNEFAESEIKRLNDQNTCIDDISEDVESLPEKIIESSEFVEGDIKQSNDQDTGRIDDKSEQKEALPDKVTESNEFTESEIKQLNDQDTGRSDEISEQPEALPEKDTKSNEFTESEIKQLNDQDTCRIEEISEQPEPELEAPPEEVTESNEFTESDIKQLNDRDADIDEVSTSPHKVLISETAIEENVSEVHVMPNEISEEVQLGDSDKICDAVAESLEQEHSGKCEPSENISDSVDEIPECSIISNSIYPEIETEEDEDALKEVENPQSKHGNVATPETVPIEEDKQEQDIIWVEEVLSNDEEPATSTEVIQDDETENVDNKVIEILDDDSKIMPVETECVPFFSPCVDSDSEDTVPTLALEPDEVIPSPEQSSTEKEDIEELSLTAHSTSETEMPDKLPEIEEILNDQGNVDDIVESIDMQENLETILAVASLQNSIDQSEMATDSHISDNERKEMEALRKAVESITETSSAEYGDVSDLTELTENILPESEVVDNLIETSNPDLNEAHHMDIKGTVESEIQTDNLKGISAPSSVEEEVGDSVNNSSSIDDSKFRENDSTQELTKETVEILPDTSEDKIEGAEIEESNEVLPDSSQGTLASDETKLTEFSRERESKNKMHERPKRHKKYADNKLEELSINVDVPEREKPYSPKVTIKPIKVPDEEVSTTSSSDLEFGKGSLKMTITKQSDKMHSVLKICESENSESAQEQEEPIPKLIIKPKIPHVEQQHSPKMSTRSSKQMYSPTSSTQRSGSPRITIKPVLKPEKLESISPLKIKIKPEEVSKRHSPKLNIKLVTKPEEECRENIQSPRKVIIKPVIKPPEDMEQIQSPRITIKPIPKPESEKELISITPRLNIKLMKKQDDEDLDVDRERSSPKITIKPVIKPPELDTQLAEADDEVKKRIVLKINKGNLPTPTKESKKREHPPDDEKSEKLAKITVKFSKGGGHAHIVQQSDESNKRAHEEQSSPEKFKKLKTDSESPVLTRSKHKDVSVEHFAGDVLKAKQREIDSHIVETRSKHTHSVCDTPVEAKRAKFKEAPETSKLRETLSESPRSRTYNDNDDVRIIETKIDSPIVISEDSRSQDSGSCIIIEDSKDPLGNSPSYEISTKSIADISPSVPARHESASFTPSIPTTPTPRKRGRPRKVPIVVREEFKEQEELPKTEPPKMEEPPQVHESGRPKRSCRGQSVRATLGIKPRKPRGPGRGRGSKRGVGTRVVPMKPETELKINKTKLKLIHESLKVELLRTDAVIEKERKIFEQPRVLDEDDKAPHPVVIETVEVPPSPSCILLESPSQEPVASPPSLHGSSPKPASSSLTAEVADSSGIPSATPSTSREESAEIVMVDEETRMSADTNSRAQTPAKQVVPGDAVIEESQSSVQSTATTESGKAASSRPNKAPRLEVQEPEGAVISADQLTEYYWNGNGPFMLQEQVAQFLGIKSFKRKYPGIMRRMLEMQERDFIRESGLASEHMCDLGLTAVNSADILDIMYSDFQEKYEEYCKHQRDRQAKELINKQKALSLAASQEKNKADITEQAVNSAAQWNASFNKARKEQRKACMDLQTLTVHYPKGKLKQINKAKVGNYPVSLVPGQFTDYYKEFTPTEINNLPLNTMCYNEINIIPPEESEESASEGSDSDSDSSSTSSGSCSSSSGVEDCKLCKHTPKKGSSSK